MNLRFVQALPAEPPAGLAAKIAPGMAAAWAA